MIKFLQKEGHKLRVYIEGDIFNISSLITYLRSSFYYETDYSDEDDVDNIIFQDGDEYFFPIGLYNIILGITTKLNIEVSPDSMIPPVLVSEDVDIENTILDGIVLRPYQLDAARAALSNKRGIIQVSTGGGKTEIVLAIIKYLYDKVDGNFILCVPSTKLLYQTRDRAISRGFDENDFSILGDGNNIDESKRFCISTVQTLTRRVDIEDHKDWLSKVSMLVMDEAHHCSARTFFKVVDAVGAEYTLGVTAEPFYNDKTHKIQDLIVRGTLGPVLYRILVPQLVDLGYLSKPYLLTFHTQTDKPHLSKSLNWHTINKNLVIENQLRNDLIVRIAQSLIKIGKNPLILISQISHGAHLSSMISSGGYRVAMLTGGSSVDIYQDGRIIDQYKDPDGTINIDFTEGRVDVLVGTSVLDEGADIPSLSSVILAGGGKSPLKVVQRVGRGLRPKSGDNTTWIIDFIDNFNVVTYSHFRKRSAILSQLGMPTYQIIDSRDTDKVLSEYKSILINNIQPS